MTILRTEMRDTALTSRSPMSLVPPPASAKPVAKALAAGLAAFLTAALLAPWQQNVRGSGSVMAYVPDQRQQQIEATVDGRVARWFVNEGDKVKKGQPVVQLADNDAAILDRLGNERTAIELRYAAQTGRLESIESRISSLRDSRRAEVVSAQAKIQIANEEVLSKEQGLQAATAELETNRINFERQQSLKLEGLASTRDLELAELAFRQSEAKVQSAQAELRAAKNKFSQEKATLNIVQASTQASVAEAEASLRSAQTDMAATQGTLARLDVEIARQKQQTVLAPVNGTILRMLVRQGGEQIKQGAVLAVMVPEVDDRAVAMFVDGNDAALIRRGYKVRLQFEGWPAVQFAGWPSVAVGTFGGKVAFVDAADDGQGNFRVVVVPDPADEPWPNPSYLRQGVRAKGWFLLRQVSLGFEIWRQLNGFPPATTTPAAASERKS